VLPKLADHGVIVADNVLWGGRVLDPGSDDTEASPFALSQRMSTPTIAWTTRSSRSPTACSAPGSGGPAPAERSSTTRKEENMAVVLKATWTAKDGSEDTVLDALTKLAPLSREEPGCRFYQAYRDPAEPRVFHLFEIYDDEAAVTAHGESEHFKEYALGQAIPELEGRGREFFETIDV
jgi:quinol monooxygenase YgiN